ncbi:MAG: hypothetical protein ACLPSF_02475 [Methylocella sp.]
MKSLSSSLSKVARAASFAAVVCFAIATPFSAANAGFFDFLFAPLRPAQPSYSEQYAPRPLPKKKTAAHRPKNLVAKLHPAGRGAHATPVVALMDDESLRNGDVVMTAEGIRVFTGSAGSRHSEDEFAKISDIKGLSKTERSALFFLDSRTVATAEPAVLAGRSVAEISPAAGEMITDPRGNRIRYVGP